ncbi:MAG: class I SAM-dependent methyltransferase [Ferruginibacter sp.]
MIHYTQCPVCAAENFDNVISAKDYTVSQEQFQIMECDNCQLRFTNDVPGQAEIGPYYKSENYISHSDTNKGIINRLYHFVRGITISGKKNTIKHFTKKNKGTILDIGCGTGVFLKSMKDAGWNVTGLEPDAGARKIASVSNGINASGPERLFELTPHSFDAITLWHVLEHVHELHAYIEQIKNLLAPGGYVFIALPNYTSYDATYYKAHWAAYDVPRHLYHFSPASMGKLLSIHGLQIEKTLPMWFDSYYVSMLSEKYRSGRNNYISAFFTGSISNMKTMKNVEKCSSLVYVASFCL